MSNSFWVSSAESLPWLQASVAGSMRSSLFKDIAQRWFVVTYRHLRIACQSHIQGFKQTGCPQKSTSNYKSTLRNTSAISVPVTNICTPKPRHWLTVLCVPHVLWQPWQIPVTSRKTWNLVSADLIFIFIITIIIIMQLSWRVGGHLLTNFDLTYPAVSSVVLWFLLPFGVFRTAEEIGYGMSTECLVTDLILCGFIYVDNRDFRFCHQYESPQGNFRGFLCTRAPITWECVLVCGGRPNVTLYDVHAVRFEKIGVHKGKHTRVQWLRKSFHPHTPLY